MAPVFDLRGWVNPVREVVMEGQWPELTMDELRARIKVAGVQIGEARLEMVRGLVNMALAPIRMADSQAMKTLEPAIKFDVRWDHVTSGGGPDDAGR
jgi:hypothetical protein